MKTQIFGFGAAHDPIWDLDSGFWILVSAIRIQNPDPRIQNPTILVFWILDSELPAFRRGTRGRGGGLGSGFATRIQNPESRPPPRPQRSSLKMSVTQNPESRSQNPESRPAPLQHNSLTMSVTETTSSESRIQNPESRIQINPLQTLLRGCVEV